ncbi:MAG TPA: hypothetical protein VKB56_04895 [Terriglobales bacterium]|nr:hypothetical protein [Terriglobales bacterium]
MALVESITAPQVFLPYAIMEDGKTLSEAVARNPQTSRDEPEVYHSRRKKTRI